LAAVAEAVAAAGDPGRAEQIARVVTDPDLKADALLKVAEVVDVPRAYQIVGAVFAIGVWTTPLDVLARLCPRLVIRIADDMVRDNEPS
jgi:hypothetical protein